MARIVFITPIPPAKTGTAKYFELFLRQAIDALPNQEMLIVTGNEHPDKVDVCGGVPVILFDRFRSSSDDILVPFFANNEFHNFVYSVIRPEIKRKKIASVIHDVQCFLNIERMTDAEAQAGNEGEVLSHIKFELPRLHNWVIEKWRTRRLPPIVKFNLLAQSRVLEASDAILVHSWYGAVRIFLESSSALKLPQILVMDHPREAHTAMSNFSRAPKFVVGCFGWLTHSKRIISIVRAFSKFLTEIPPSAVGEVQLKFVGSLADKSCDPLKWADVFGCRSNCVYLGHVTDVEFKRELASVNLLMNLRFPSSGETSGTLNLARSLGVRIAVSRYQAFAEEAADYHISISEDREVDELLSAIMSEYQRWRADPGSKSADQHYSCYRNLPDKLTVSGALRYVVDEL